MKTAKRLVVTILLAVIIVTMIPVAASANGTIAWGAADITGTGIRIRSGPGLTHDVLTHVTTGDIVVIVERTNSEWYKVNFHGTVGYISVPLLDRIRDAANFNAAGSVTGNSVNMRAEPNTTSNVLSTNNSGTVMQIIGINKGWYKVQHGGNTGYIRSDFMTLLSQSDAAASNLTTTGSVSSAPSANRSLGQQIADYGVSLKGVPYVWAGTSPSGFDCSGFVTYVLRNFDIRVTRQSAGMHRDNGVHINKSDLVPGDLVFFSRNGSTVSHVGIYIGNGQYVHSSSSGGVGVIVSSLNSSWATRTFFGAKRVI